MAQVQHAPQPTLFQAPPLIEEETVEVDDRDAESVGGDSTFSDVSSYTTSLISEVTNYRYENDRRYHSDRFGNYVLPNDEQEVERLDVCHEMFKRRLNGKLHLAPIGDNPQRILDIGTGAGQWAIEMGDNYPSAEVIGNDLSPIQPTWVPPNVKFEVDDAELDWTYRDDFDYIHVRWMAAGIKDWPRLLQQAYQHLKPGGWMEVQEVDINIHSEDKSLADDDPLRVWNQNCQKAIAVDDRSFSPGPHIRRWMEEAGYVNVKEYPFKLPIGVWPKDKDHKDVGALNYMQMVEGLEAYSLALYTRFLKWSKEETLVFLPKVRKSLNDPKIHSLYRLYVSIGQKPEAKQG